MNARHEALFDRIADECISAAEDVECSGLDFVEGLKLIRDKVADRIASAEEEFKEEED